MVERNRRSLASVGFVLDAVVVSIPALLAVLCAVLVGMWALGLPTPAGFLFVLGLSVLANLAHVGLAGLGLARQRFRGLRDVDSTRFWLGVLTHYLSVGSTLFYLYEMRDGRLMTERYEAYRKEFRTRFVVSRLTRVARIANRAFGPLILACVLFGYFVAFALRSDAMFVGAIRLVALVFTGGGALSSYFVVMLLRDAVIRWQASPSERHLAKTIYSSPSPPRAAERYFRALLLARQS